MAKSSVVVELPTHTVPIRNQQILGKKSSLSSDVEEFRGIPFGFVPGRWQHSQVRRNLPQDVFSAFHNGPKCPQPDEVNNTVIYQSNADFPLDVSESETDCLNLFIVRPSRESLARVGYKCAPEGLPVLVWIHGGGYGFGAATDPIWDPARLVMKSISLGTPFIAVSLNYRLGLFGFAASSDLISTQSDSGIRGCNFGLRDQKVGLEWVSQNIAAFGGDAAKITIGGQSAGGCSVQIHAIEAKIKPRAPLFRNAIIQSGAVGCIGPISLKRADAHWETLCQHLGLKEIEGRSRLSDLEGISASGLIQAARELGWYTYPLVDDKMSLTVTDDGSVVKVNLDEDSPMRNGLAPSDSGSFAVLMGDAEAEGVIFERQICKIKSFEEIRSIFHDTFASPDSADDLLRAYGIFPGLSVDDLHSAIARFLSEFFFSYPIFRAYNFFNNHQPTEKTNGTLGKGELHSASRSEVFQRTVVDSYKIKFGNPFDGPYKGMAHHCVELIYLFDAFHDDLLRADKSALPSKVKFTNAELKEEIQKQWISFIADDHAKAFEEQGLHAKESRITVYGTDRRPVIESLDSDTEWIEQRVRFSLVAKHADEILLATNRITNPPNR